MFVTSQQVKEKSETLFIYDKSLPKGSNPERFVSSSLTVETALKAAAHTKFFDMSQKNNFVTDAVCIFVTPAEQKLLSLIRGNSNDLHAYLKDALERATYLCEFDISQEQLRGDYHLTSVLDILSEINSQTLTID